MKRVLTALAAPRPTSRHWHGSVRTRGRSPSRHVRTTRRRPGNSQRGCPGPDAVPTDAGPRYAPAPVGALPPGCSAVRRRSSPGSPSCRLPTPRLGEPWASALSSNGKSGTALPEARPRGAGTPTRPPQCLLCRGLSSSPGVLLAHGWGAGERGSPALRGSRSFFVLRVLFVSDS